MGHPNIGIILSQYVICFNISVITKLWLKMFIFYNIQIFTRAACHNLNVRIANNNKLLYTKLYY